MRRVSNVLVFITGAALAACGSVAEEGPDAGGPVEEQPDGGEPGDPDGGDPGGNPDAGPSLADAGIDAGGGTVDTIAPTVLSVSPVDGAAGVSPDQVIEIRFSEPMDQAAVEAAWTSADVPASAVDFAWSAGGDVLTVTPDEPLPLAEGTGLDPGAIEPLELSYTLAATASDLAGNQLGTDRTVFFRTQRRLTAGLGRIDALTRTLRSDGLAFGDSAVQLTVGDDTSNRQTKSFASFEVPELPAGAEIERAVLAVHQSTTHNTPYVLGSLEVFHVSVAAIDESSFSPSLAEIGVISTTTDPGQKTLDVTGYFQDDHDNREARGGRTQYRLEFPTGTNGNAVLDDVRLSRSGFALTVVYRVD